MDLEGFMNLKRFVELKYLLILLLGVTIYAVMTAYTGFRIFLARNMQLDSQFLL